MSQVHEPSDGGAVEVRSTTGGEGFLGTRPGGGSFDLLEFDGRGSAPWLPAGFSLLVGT